MTKVLGLDLGTNSIGWALVDDVNEKILGIGSRIFPEGVVNLGEGEGREASKNSSRTDDRGTRRQFLEDVYVNAICYESYQNTTCVP